MTKYLAGVLSVIAVGVLLIAYGLLNPRVPAYAYDPRTDLSYTRPMLAGERMMLPDDPYARYEALNGYRPAYASQVETYQPARPVRTSQTLTSGQRARTTTVVRSPQRDWKKTALVIGGSTAAGAGLGGIFGGKKGALIGAAIGGGASTLFEATRK